MSSHRRGGPPPRDPGDPMARDGQAGAPRVGREAHVQAAPGLSAVPGRPDANASPDANSSPDAPARPDTHGGKIREASELLGIPGGELLDFSANINFLGPSPQAVAAARRAVDEMGWYP
ncbi:MAG: hypothetical protein ACYC5Q_08190, partial [Thermoleophilia bacterium]